MIEQQWEIQNPDADRYNRQFWKIADYNLSTNKLAFIHFNYPFINMFIPSTVCWRVSNTWLHGRDEKYHLVWIRISVRILLSGPLARISIK